MYITLGSTDKNLSSIVFGGKQSIEFWNKVLETGKTPAGVPVLAKPLDLQTMIQDRTT